MHTTANGAWVTGVANGGRVDGEMKKRLNEGCQFDPGFEKYLADRGDVMLGGGFESTIAAAVVDIWVS